MERGRENRKEEGGAASYTQRTEAIDRKKKRFTRNEREKGACTHRQTHEWGRHRKQGQKERKMGDEKR